jgi:effector-binding domain-containing protein
LLPDATLVREPGGERVADQPRTETRIVHVEPQPTAAVRFQRPMASVDVGALMGAALGSLGARLGGAGVAPAGPPYARYHAWGGDLADVEIGFPIAQPIPDLTALGETAEGDVGASELPGGRVAVIVHHGPYTELGDAHGRLHDWVHAQGEDEAPGPWESYIDNPEEVDDPADLRTEIRWPLTER